MAAAWNKCAGARSPSRRCSAERCRRAPGVVPSRIGGSGEVSCSEGGRRGGGDGGLVEFWSLAPSFVLVWLLLAMPWGCWGWWGGELALGAGCLLCLYRSGFSGISEFSAVFRFVLLLPSPAGRGGEGCWCGQGGSSAVAPAGHVRAQCRESWMKGGSRVEASWPYSFSVLRSRCLRRAAPAAFFMSVVSSSRGWWRPGTFFFGVSSATRFCSRRSGGSAFSFCGSSGFAVVLGFLALFVCVFLSFFSLCCTLF